MEALDQNKIVDPYAFETVFHKAVIESTVDRLSKELWNYYDMNEVVEVIVLMDGSFTFAADLLRKISFPIRTWFIKASSYKGAAKSELKLCFAGEFTKKAVLIIDDIVDTGDTIVSVRNLVNCQQARDIKTCALLQRQRPFKYQLDFLGHTIYTDEFVVGYGMDFNGLYRNLPMIKALPKSLYLKATAK